MAFFEVPPPPPPPKRTRRRKRRDEHYHRPALVVPGYLPGFVLVRTRDRAVVVGQIQCYPTGFGFDLETVSRYDVDPSDDPGSWGLGMYPHPRPHEVSPSVLRFGIEYGNGRKATTLDIDDWYRPFGRETVDDGPHINNGGGGGSAAHYSHELWVWPLPPDGPVRFVCEWPAFGIEETSHRIAGARFRRAAARAKPLFES